MSKKRTNRRYNKKKLRIIFILVILFIIIKSSLFIKDMLASNKEDALLKNNYNTLKNMENKNVSTIENEINKKNKESQNHIATSSNSPKSNNRVYFENSVFMGDSQTEPLEAYNILNKSSVLAKKGQNVMTAKPFASGLKSLNPERVFLLYGMNDLQLFQDSNDFKTNYIKLVQAVKQNAPNAKIYLQSVMPVQPKVAQKDKSFSDDRIERFLQVVKDVAAEEKVNFIDIRSIVKGRDTLYEPDGMHFTAKFYDVLLNYLKDQLEQ